MTKKHKTKEEVRAELIASVDEESLNMDIVDKIMTLPAFADELDKVRRRVLSVNALIKLHDEFASINSNTKAKPKSDPTAVAPSQKERQASRAAAWRQRGAAISRIIAIDAARRADVIDFREYHLSGKLVPADGVEDWVYRLAEAEAPPTVWLEVPLPRGTKLRETSQGIEFAPELHLKRTSAMSRITHILKFANPGSKRVLHQQTTHEGTLEALRVLSKRLSEEYFWSEPQATFFILTGKAPLIHTPGFQLFNRLSLSSMSRIVMTIDPAMKPDAVAQEYKRLRSRITRGRSRAMTRKHLDLAIFAAEHKDDEKTWPDRLRVWNDEHENEWNYASVESFRRDCRKAFDRLMYPKYTA